MIRRKGFRRSRRPGRSRQPAACAGFAGTLNCEQATRPTRTDPLRAAAVSLTWPRIGAWRRSLPRQVSATNPSISIRCPRWLGNGKEQSSLRPRGTWLRASSLSADMVRICLDAIARFAGSAWAWARRVVVSSHGRDGNADGGSVARAACLSPPRRKIEPDVGARRATQILSKRDAHHMLGSLAISRRS